MYNNKYLRQTWTNIIINVINHHFQNNGACFVNTMGRYLYYQLSHPKFKYYRYFFFAKFCIKSTYLTSRKIITAYKCYINTYINCYIYINVIIYHHYTLGELTNEFAEFCRHRSEFSRNRNGMTNRHAWNHRRTPLLGRGGSRLKRELPAREYLTNSITNLR